MRLSAKRIWLGALSFGMLIISISTSFATTYYVDSSAANDSGSGSVGSPKKFISSGIRLMSSNGGDTLVLASGTYSDPKDAIEDNFTTRVSGVVNGKPGAYNVIKAEVDGGAILTEKLRIGRLDLNSLPEYIQFEGLHWKSTQSKGVVGHHLKFLRCAFEGGPTDGNSVNFGIGTNQILGTPVISHHILVEDSWAYGLGGRYNILVYNSHDVILRRVVVRHDGGWRMWPDASNTNGPPEAGITIYSAYNVSLQNTLIIDSDLGTYKWVGAYYVVNNAGNLDTDNTILNGAMSVNNTLYAVHAEGSDPITNTIIKNSVSVDDDYGVAFRGVNSSSGSVTNMSVINCKRTGLNIGYANPDSSVRYTFTNNVVSGCATGFKDNSNGSIKWAESYNNCSNNGGSSICRSGTDTSFDAFSNGLLYPLRIEKGSQLDSAGQSGSNVGANIVYKVGVTGSLADDPGFDTETTDSLWPWPHEDRIKSEMCNEATTGVADRGFCATGLSITEYIWSKLGNAVPSWAARMEIPPNVRMNRN